MFLFCSSVESQVLSIICVLRFFLDPPVSIRTRITKGASKEKKPLSLSLEVEDGYSSRGKEKERKNGGGGELWHRGPFLQMSDLTCSRRSCPLFDFVCLLRLQNGQKRRWSRKKEYVSKRHMDTKATSHIRAPNRLSPFSAHSFFVNGTNSFI